MNLENEEIDLGWELLEKGGFIKEEVGCAAMKGSGITIFRFFPEYKKGTNCEVYYATKNGFFWNEIVRDTSTRRLFEKYDPVECGLFLLQIPCGDGDTIGSLRLYGMEGKCVMDSRTL